MPDSRVSTFSALASSSNEKARCSVLKLALISLDHDDEQLHNEEINFGADIILCRCLRRAVSLNIESRETNRLCRLLEAVYKCSDETAIFSVAEHGAILYPLLVTISSHPSASLRSQMIAIRLLQRVKPSGVSLSEVKDADLLLIAIVRFLRTGTDRCRKHALIALDGITVHFESRPIASRYPGLLEAVVLSGDIWEEEALVVLVNFAMDARSKSVIVETRGLLALLGRACLSQARVVRCLACTVLQHLSSEISARDALVNFETNVLVHNLVSMLRDKESTVTIRSKALQTLSNLVCETTARAIGSIPNIFEQLAEAASSSPATNHSSVAAKAIKRLSLYIKIHHKCHQSFCDALVSMSRCPTLDVSLWTVRAYVEQSLEISSSFILVRSESNINGLLALARSKHARVRAFAVEAIANLAQEAANAKRLSTHGAVFDILITSIEATCDDDDGSEDVRREAVRAILLMANHRTASKRVAKYCGLIRSLSTYGTSIDGDVDLKRAALHGVLVLAPAM
jgi:hypothetical protein